MRIIGVTGGIGCGKSTVSRILTDLGAKVIDADRISRELLRKGEKAYDEVLAFFGDEIKDGKGELDRKRLAEVVFRNPDKLLALNGITHGYISERIRAGIEKIISEGKTEIIVIDVPLPVREGFLELADEVWTVTSDKERRVKRIIERSGMTREDILSRMEAQGREEAYTGIADEIIENDGSIEDLEKVVARLYVKTKSEKNPE